MNLSPILIIAYNRYEKITQILNILKNVKNLSSIYFKIDGPRNKQDLFKITTIHDLIRNKTYNCSQITNLFLNRIEKFKDLNAIININSQVQLEAAKLDEYYAKNSKLIGQLHCIPTIVKDNIDIAGMPTTAGLKAFQTLFANKDALIIQRLRKHGALFLAKSNMAELAYFNSNNAIFKEL
jgi:amidase